jgi:hypothetical protein
MSVSPVETERAEHPVDVVERLAAGNQWSFDRDDEDEISITVAGAWTSYHIAFTWLPEVEALHAACGFDLKVSEARRPQVQALVSFINEQLWVGHFDLWSSQDIVIFRHALLLAGGAEPSGRQCEVILKTAVEACERYYQAFQFVVWAGKDARAALDCAMFETLGKA